MIKNGTMIELERENVSLKSTLKYISHELLNVLTLVDYSVKVVDGSVDEMRNNQYWKYITEDVDYMVQLLKGLSDYNHCGELKKECCNLSKIIYYISEEMNEKYNDRASIDVCIDGTNDDFYIEVDKNKIRQVIINLIKNAIESFDSNEKGNIAINLKREKKWINIDVLDNGCGIEEENILKIFEEGTSIEKKDGSGLGLAISKKIIESHDGEISVESTYNKGTTFHIQLPY